jgi:DNA-binding XRE family transcriptional regulator
MTKTKDDFGVRVKNLREELHYTQEAMAESPGVSFATVNSWENGWTEPSNLALRQFDLFESQDESALLNCRVAFKQLQNILHRTVRWNETESTNES